MSKTTINVGSSPNAGDGDPLRTAMIACNSNFSQLYDPDGEIYTPGFSPTPLCQSNTANVGLGYNTYMLGVSDSFSQFNKCKVYVDSVSAESARIQVAVYTNDFGDLDGGLKAFQPPSAFALKLAGLFTAIGEGFTRGLKTLLPDPTVGVDNISQIERGQNLLIVTSLNDQVSLAGINVGFPAESGLFSQGLSTTLTNETDIQTLLGDAQEVSGGVPSLQFYYQKTNLDG